MELKLEKLQELNNLQEKITGEILDVITNASTEWEYHSVDTNPGDYDDTQYVSTPFKGGFILLVGCRVYYSTTNNEYTWQSIKAKSIDLGSYDIAAEVFFKLEDMHYRMNILSA